IIFGGLWGLCLLCCGTSLLIVLPTLSSPEVLNANPKDRDVLLFVQEYLDSVSRNVPLVREVLVGGMVLWIVLSMGLIVSGIGLLLLKPWARWLCLIYAVLSIVAQLAVLGYSIGVMNPAMHVVNEEMIEYLRTHPLKGAPP